MEETTSRKLHFILEVLIVAAIIFAFALVRSAIFSVFTNMAIAGSMEVRTLSTIAMILNLGVGAIALFAGSFVCFNVIEKRPVSWGILLLLSVLYKLMLWIPAAMINAYIARFGTEPLALYSQITAYLSPVLAAVIMVLMVRLLCMPRVEVSPADPAAKFSLAAHVLLLLFVGGIWRCIWIYRTTRYLNCLPDEEYRNPGAKLLLCMFVPFYSIYWVYKSARRIDKLAASTGVTSDLALVCLILEIFVPIVPPILMQDKINKILDAQM